MAAHGQERFTMIVDDVRTSSQHQLASVLHTLKHVHGVDLKLDESSSEEIELLRDSSEIIKNSIVSEGAFNTWHSNPSYAKHMLILEATRLYLREIAPKRRPRTISEGVETKLEEGRAEAVGRWMMDFSGKHKAKDDRTLAMLNSFSRVGEDLTTIGEPFGPKNMGELVHSYKARAEDEAGEDFDRRQARENLHALKLGFSMYAKHAKPEVDEADTASSQALATANAALAAAKQRIMANPNLKAMAKAGLMKQFEPFAAHGAPIPTEAEIDAYFSDTSNTSKDPLVAIPGLRDRMNKWLADKRTRAAQLVGVMPESDAFQAARLKAIKDGGRDGSKFMVGDKEFTLSNVGQDDIARAKEIDEMASLIGKALTEDHMQAHDYQASMARAELYRNAKYGMDMLRMIRPADDVEPWIAACLTKSAMQLDKIYHYLDYYLKFEPDALGMRPTQQRPEMPLDEDVDDSTGTTARQNLMMIVEYSIKLFHMIQPGDKLEGWVAMMLTKASEGMSSCKHWMDYKQFERHAGEHVGLSESVGLEEAPTRKDFKMVADLIKAHPDPDARHHMAMHHSEIFAKRNPRFNRGRFFTAANASMTPPKKHVKKADKKVDESALLEATEDLAQAETLIAAKSLSDELQSMAEKVAKMGVEDLMPLVDTMKEQFGPEAAEGYNEIMKTSLESLLKSTQDAKDRSDDAVMALQGGSVPASPTDIAAVGAEAGDEAGDATVGQELPPPDETGTMPAAAGGAEPLGRRKKPEPVQEEGVTEAWDAEMKTAEKDKGKWDGWTLERLKAKKKDLMDKPSRTPAEQKTVKQIDFAIRAKQKDKWGKVSESDDSMVAENAGLGILVRVLVALGLGAYGAASLMSNTKSGKDTPLGKAMTAAAAKGDQNAAKELRNLDMYIEAGDWDKLEMLKDTYLDVGTGSPAIKEETTHTKDERAEKAGRTVAKDIEYDERKKDGIHGAKRGKEDDKAERAGRRVAKDIEHDEKMHEAKKSKPDFLDVDKDGDKKEPMKKALKDKKKGKVDEAKKAKKKDPHAIGMYQAKKEAGMDPDRPAHDLPKKVIKRAHEIARGIEKTDEQLAKLGTMLESAESNRGKLASALGSHRRAWSRMVSEGVQQDVLGVGQGFDGDMLQRRISEADSIINGIKTRIAEIEAREADAMARVIEHEKRAYRFQQAKARTPWGVMFESNGARDYKFFEDQRARDYWVQLNADMDVKLIDPSHFDMVANA